jgi:dephospho-CoA kinase
MWENLGMIQNKKIIVITGPIASGKSTATKYFEKKGYNVIDADIVSRQVMEKGQDCYFETIKEFGNEILDSNGIINRKTLGEIVFNDKNKLMLLNQITHKHIENRIMEIINNLSSDELFLDIPLFFNSPYEKIADTVICVNANIELRVSRIISRNQLTKDEALSRIYSQRDFDLDKAKCDYIIVNENDYETLEKSLSDIMRKILTK